MIAALKLKIGSTDSQQFIFVFIEFPGGTQGSYIK